MCSPMVELKQGGPYLLLLLQGKKESEKWKIQIHLGSLKSCPNATSRRTSQICLPFLKKLLNDPCSWVFKDPVDPIELGLPDYLDVIKTPMDLTLIGKKLESGDYNEIETFGQEIRLVFDNAIVYNGECSDVGAMAKKLLNMFD